MDLSQIEYKNDLYYAYLKADREYREACRYMYLKQRELPARKWDISQRKQWADVRFIVSEALRARNTALDEYNYWLRRQLSPEAILPEFSAKQLSDIPDVIEAQSRSSLVETDNVAFQAIINAAKRHVVGEDPELLAKPKERSSYRLRSVDGLEIPDGEYSSGRPEYESTPEERAKAAQEYQENLDYFQRLEDFNKANPSKEPPAPTPVWKGKKTI